MSWLGPLAASRVEGGPLKSTAERFEVLELERHAGCVFANEALAAEFGFTIAWFASNAGPRADGRRAGGIDAQAFDLIADIGTVAQHSSVIAETIARQA